MLDKLRIIGDYFPYCLTIVDTKSPGRPCLYANQHFAKNTGYPVDSILGKNLAFLQGERTDKDTISFMRKCFAQEVACLQDMINYKKNGELFINRLLMLPMKFEDQVFYVGFQNNMSQSLNIEESNKQLRKISDGEIKHVVNNSLTIILGKMTLALMNTNDPLKLKKEAEKISHAFERINQFVLNAEDMSTFEDFILNYHSAT